MVYRELVKHGSEQMWHGGLFSVKGKSVMST